MPSWTPAPYSLPYITGQDVLEQTPSTNEAQIRKIAQYLEQLESSLVDRIDAQVKPRYLGEPSHLIGNAGIGASGPYHCTAIAFNGEVGDVWTANFFGTNDIPPGGTPGGIPASCTMKLATVAGVPLHSPNPSASWTMGCSNHTAPDPATYTWRATAANDYLLVWIVRNDHGVGNLRVYASGLINHGNI